MRLACLGLQIAAFTVILLVGCKQKKESEQDQYASKQKSLVYKTYQTSSAALVKASVAAYNFKSPDSLKVNEPIVHLFLAYNWAVINKPTLALAEANMLEEKYKEDTGIIKMVPLIRSISLYESGWPQLAKTESDKGMKYIGLNPAATEDRQKVMLFHLLMATVCIKEKQFDAAEFHVNGLSIVAKMPWLATLASGMNDIKKKNIQSGLQKIKQVSRDEAVPSELRAELKSSIEMVEAKGGDVEATLFWPKLMGSLIMDQLSKSSDSYLKPVMDMVQSIATSLKDKIPSF